MEIKTLRVKIDPKIRFLLSVPDGKPDEATHFQGFAYSLCQNSGLLRFIQQMPTDIFELIPDARPYRIARRIAGHGPINWYGQSPRALKSHPIPLEAAFTIVMLDRSEKASDYDEWLASCPGSVTLVAEAGGKIAYSDLSFESVRARFLEVCGVLRALDLVENINEAEAAIAAWMEPEERRLSYEIGGHGTISPNAAVLRVCGFVGIGNKPLGRFCEKTHVEQIILTANSIFDERDANPFSRINQIYPRSPDLNLYIPATYDIKSTLSLRPDLDRAVRREIEAAIRMLDKQSSYSFELSNEANQKLVIGIMAEASKGALNLSGSVIAMRQHELWLGTEAVACLAASEIGAVVRLPNRLNLTRGVVRQFAQHYRADRPQMHKRSEQFRNVQRAIAQGFPSEFQALIDRSQDGIRIIADAHIEWLDVRGIPLGLRYNVSRIPVTPGNLFIDTLSTPQPIHLKPEDFQDVLIVSGLSEADKIAQQFTIAFDQFGKQWRDKLRVKLVRVTSRQELIAAINAFEGVLMVFDGHGTHKPDQPGFLWLGKEPVDVWGLRGEIHRPPPIVILSACDTHAADRNHATVANGFLALGCRSVLGSVFPLHASHAAVFAARLLYRVSDYIPAAVAMLQRSLTWLEVVSGMLRRQITTDILRHLEGLNLIAHEHFLGMSMQMHHLADLNVDDPFSKIRQILVEYGISESRLDREIHCAIAASSTISYLHLGRPETILVNSDENMMKWRENISQE